MGKKSRKKHKKQQKKAEGIKKQPAKEEEVKKEEIYKKDSGAQKKEKEIAPQDFSPPEQRKQNIEKAATILITDIGSNGCYFLNMQVLDIDGKPDAGAIVRILDADHQDKFYDLPPTNKNGITQHTIKFDKPTKRIGVVVLGTKILTRWMNLSNKLAKKRKGT